MIWSLALTIGLLHATPPSGEGIDPVQNRIYLLMIQRADIGNSDASEMRRAFQDAAAPPL
jgi:hypothetical protein